MTKKWPTLVETTIFDFALKLLSILKSKRSNLRKKTNLTSMLKKTIENCWYEKQ